MDGQIVSRETIFDLAQAAAVAGQCVNSANPYPEHSEAHRQFERDYWAAVRELETNGEVA